MMDCLSRNWRQFWLLLWKNWLLQKRRVTRTVLIILFPIGLALILVVMRQISTPRFVSNETTYDSFIVTSSISYFLKYPPEISQIAYAPNSYLVARIVNRAATLMGVEISEDMGFASETALEKYVSANEDIFGALVFDFSDDMVDLPGITSYKIRLRSGGGGGSGRKAEWKTKSVFSGSNRTGPREADDTFGGKDPGYHYSGFLAIQRAVDLSLIAEVNPNFDPTTMNVTIQLKRYPYPVYEDDQMIRVIRDFFPLFVLLSFIFIVPTICQEIVHEKETKLKVSMKLMGMRMWLYWSSWFIKYLLFMLVSVVFITFLIHAPISSNGPVLGHGSATVTFVFLLLYTLSLITFCFAISTLVSSASYAPVVGCILFVLSFTPYFYLGTIYDDMNLEQKFGASVDFNLAMAFGCFKISEFEAVGIGVQWSNVDFPAYADDHTMFHVLIMLSVDIILYAILAFCFDALMPGDFGSSHPLSLLCTKKYWMGGRRGQQSRISNEDFMTLVPEDKSPYFDVTTQDENAGIQIRGLTKNFGSGTNPAVNNINIDFYEEAITAVVGHSRSGKTTTMLMLAGFLPPSSGTAYINRFDVTQEMDVIRENLGLCPQHDIMFESLTVRENLLFFAILKGSSMRDAKQDGSDMLRLLRMKDKSSAIAKTLSGGQKRKLTVGIALITGSKFVILDEPTSGMDPESRRQTWDILQSQKRDRTIVLLTNSIDEAEVLGDRIAIMYSGEIECYGTSTFLKNKYRVGYHLIVGKKHDCDVSRVREVVKSHIPIAHAMSNNDDEVGFILPSQYAPKFAQLFEALEADRRTLGIASLAVSVMTMKEVFSRVKDSPALEGGPRISILDDAELLRDSSPTDVLYRKERGCRHQNLQLRAMFYKRIIHSVRSYVLTPAQILIPVLFAIFACLVLLDLPREDQLPPRTLELTEFKDAITPYDVQPPESEKAQQMAAFYVASVSDQSKPVYINSKPGYSTMDNYLLEIGRYHEDQYSWNYQIGATIAEEPSGHLNITGYFNNQAYHTIAISLSYIGNTLMLRYGDADHQIETINHPLPKNPSEHIKDIVGQENSRVLGFALLVSVGLAFLFATFVVFLVKERKSGAKHVQLVSGVRLYNFWLTTFLWDFVNYLVPCILIIAVIFGFFVDGYWQRSWIIFIGLMLYGFSMLPLTYVMSFFFVEASVGFVWLFVIYVITGTLTTVTIFMMQILTPPNTWQTVEWVFYIVFPTYCFNAILQNIYRNHENHEICNSLAAENEKLADFCGSVKQNGQSHPCCRGNCGGPCMEMVDNYFSWTLPGVLRPLVFMAAQGIVFFFILYIIEKKLVLRLLRRMAKKRVSEFIRAADADADDDAEDPDVLAERERIRSNPDELIKTDPVVVQDLTKLYGNFVAVNQLTVGVLQKECFGLLGVNGAGKTTVLKMLTGEIRSSFGSAYIDGLSVEDDIAKVRQRIGYCPQFDSIFEQLTVHETLWMYACARGVPLHATEQVINRLIEFLTLKPYTRRRVGHLSNGNKRKLCVAISLMGNPTVVFLDEPTTGVDPEARRHVWNTLAAARNTGTTFVLTSQSMEECEAVCTGMGIFVNGRFLCLGSPQFLRDKFSEGYTITIKLQRSADTEKPEKVKRRIDRVQTFVTSKFPKSVLTERRDNLLIFEVKRRTFRWSKIFRYMEQAKGRYNMEDYSVGQPTLHQLFMDYSRQQQGPRIFSKKKK